MLFIFSCILLHLASLTIAQTDLMYHDCSNDVGNYTTNSNFQRNLNSVLSSLDSNTQIDYGFYNLSVGQPGPDQANVIALCRGDIGVDECQNCIRNSSGEILQACPNQKEAFGIADACNLRYSNKSIFGVMEDNPVSILVNTANATDVNQFDQVLQTLMSRLRSTAASGNSLRKFATGDETAGFDTIFGLVQCTPDLSEPQGDDCIAGAIREIATCCGGQLVGRQGVRIARPSCNLRYEVYRFFGVTPATPQLPASPSPQAPSVPPPPPAEGKKRNNARTIIIIVVSTVSVVILMISCICLYLRIRKPKEKVESNYTTNSNFQRNLDSVLSSLDSNTQIDYGFYNLSVGQPGPDQANVIALCRGDIGVDECQNCIRNSSDKILQACPNQKEAFGFADTCILRYSNKSIFGVVEDNPEYFMWNTANATDVNQFNQALQTLMSRLRSTAASGNSLRKFATGNETAGFDTIFGLVQCTPDLSEPQCDDCIARAIREIAECCGGQVAGKQGARITRPSCNLRYEVYRFFGVTPSPQAEGKKRNNARTIIIIVVSTVSVVILMISCICLYLRIRKPKEKVETVDEMITAESLQVDFSTIRAATDDFSEENKLGQGGFGSVYKGTLPNGQEVAVKRLSKDSGQGDLEFKNEVLLVAKLQHRNLVRLLGFCLQGIERLLIYEFVLNASLDHFIFNQARRAQLDWERRYKIIGGIARGLLYLHEDSRLRIIHRDLKASNILLDADMNPKISDFGMARLFVMDETQGNTSRIVGTYGYMAPEYAMHGQFSVKSDVFSFGVLILEIVSGQKNNSFRNGETVEDLLSYAWRNWRDGTGLNVIDPALSTGSRTEMMRCIHIGLLCVLENIADRPTMASIVLMLSSHSLTLPVPSQPAFFMSSSTYQSDISSSMDYNSRVAHSSEAKTEALPLSVNEASITELYPR